MFKHYSWNEKLPVDWVDTDESNTRLFFETMYDRHMIWKKRFIDGLPKPWTDDKIFQTSKFTNVYRELDKNSQWQIKNIITDESLTLKNLIWKMMVFRFFNNPATFEFDVKGKAFQMKLFDDETDVGIKKASEAVSATKWKNGIPDWDEYDEEEFIRFISGVRASGQNPYTSAYLINSMACPGKTRDYCYTKKVIPFLHANVGKLIKVVKTAKTPEEIINFLQTFPSVAGFIAHEFYQDFTYIPKYTNREFMKFDQNDFTNVGPGASLGIRLIYPSLRPRSKQTVGIYDLRDVSEKWLKKIGEERGEPFPYLHWNKDKKQYYVGGKHNITLHQIEMWLCEFGKYWKMTIGEGKQREKFNPTTKSL